MDDALQRLIGVVRVQRAQHQVARFGKMDRVFHRLARAHLANQDHVRRLAQRVLQRVFPAIGIDAQFALRDDAALVLVHVFDRVFDGDDVPGGILVAVADDRRERRGLARAGGADEDHDAALGHRQLLDDRQQVQFLDRRNLGFDPPKHHAHAIALVEAGDAEAADARDADRELAFVGLLELLALRRRHYVQHHVAGFLRRQWRLRDRHDAAVDLDRRRDAGRDEQVRRLLVYHQLEKRAEIDAAHDESPGPRGPFRLAYAVRAAMCVQASRPARANRSHLRPLLTSVTPVATRLRRAYSSSAAISNAPAHAIEPTNSQYSVGVTYSVKPFRKFSETVRPPAKSHVREAAKKR